MDHLTDYAFQKLLTVTMSDPSNIARALDLIPISRNLERIADHVTNIAEDVVYVARGESVAVNVPGQGEQARTSFGGPTTWRDGQPRGLTMAG